MQVFCPHTYPCTTCTWKPEETEIIDGRTTPCGCWEPNLQCRRATSARHCRAIPPAPGPDFSVECFCCSYPLSLISSCLFYFWFSVFVYVCRFACQRSMCLGIHRLVHVCLRMWRPRLTSGIFTSHSSILFNEPGSLHQIQSSLIHG